jgi:hypothetical protein
MIKVFMATIITDTRSSLQLPIVKTGGGDDEPSAEGFRFNQQGNLFNQLFDYYYLPH